MGSRQKADRRSSARPAWRRYGFALLAGLAVALGTGVLHAGNGFKPIAVGAAAAGRGGTDTAIGTDSSALLSNPAGLGRVPGSELNMLLVPYWGNVKFSNSMNDGRQHGGPLVVPGFTAALDFQSAPFKSGAPARLAPAARTRFVCRVCGGNVGSAYGDCPTCGSRPGRAGHARRESSSSIANVQPAQVTRRSDIPWRVGLGVGLPIAPMALGKGDPYRTESEPNGKKDDEIAAFGIGLATGVGAEVVPGLSLGFGLQYYYARLDKFVSNMKLRNSRRRIDHASRAVSNIEIDKLQLYDPFGSGAKLFQVGLGSSSSGGNTAPPVTSGSGGSRNGAASTSYRLQRGVGLNISGGDAEGRAFGLSLGAILDVNERCSVGFSWTSPVKFPAMHGEVNLDATQGIETFKNNIMAEPGVQAVANLLLGSQGLNKATANGGTVGGLIEGLAKNMLFPNGGRDGFLTHYDVELSGVQLPQTLGVGLAYEPLDSWRVAADLKWINWSKAFDVIRIKATNGTNEDINSVLGGPDVETGFDLGWRDQLVTGLGIEKALSRNLLVRVGYNYGRNPVPDRGVSTSMPIAEHHLTLGFSWLSSGNWHYDVGLVHAFESVQRVDEAVHNTDLDQTTFKSQSDALFIGISYEF